MTLDGSWYPGRKGVAAIAPAFALVIALATPMLTTGAALAADEARDFSKYPNWRGAWARFEVPGLGGQPSHDQTKPWGFGQEAPLTPEYTAVLQASIADQADGGQGNFTGSECLAFGMPTMMMAFYPQEHIITPQTTYILLSGSDHLRRVFTDGRDWPKNPQPTYGGYSIGRWIDQDGEGRYDMLESETRYFKGPRAFDASGLPLAFDNQSVFKERFFVDKTNPDIMHVLTTVIDSALTRPWTSDRQYMRVAEKVEQWPETWCQEGNHNIVIGKENYLLRSDGLLMPTKRNQEPPDLSHFKQPQP